MYLGLEKGARRPRDSSCASWWRSSTSATQVDFDRGQFRVRGDRVEIFPAYEETAASRSSSSATRSSASRRSTRSRGKVLARDGPQRALSRQAIYVIPRRDAPGGGRHPGGVEGAPGRAEGREQAAGGPAPGAAHPLRPGDDEGDGLLPRHRELLPPPRRPRGRGRRPRPCWTTFPGTPWWSSTKATSPSPSSGACTGGPHPQARPWWITASACPAPWTTGPSSSRSSRRRCRSASTSSATPGDYELKKSAGAGGRADHPPHRPDGPGSWSRARPGPGGRPAGRDAPAGGQGRAGAGDHAHQAHGRGPDRLFHGAGHQGALPALRHRHPGAGGDPARPAPGGLRRAWWGSTSCGKAWTCRRCRLVAILDADKEGFLRSRPQPDPDHGPGRPQRGGPRPSSTPPAPPTA